jgi:hypothetical protein
MIICDGGRDAMRPDEMRRRGTHPLQDIPAIAHVEITPAMPQLAKLLRAA